MTAFSTLAVITPISGEDSLYLTPFSSRGMRQKWQWIAQPSSVERDLNGVLRNVAQPQFRKRRITFSCRDVETLAADQAFVGQEISIQWAQELGLLTGSGQPFYPVTPGSLRTEGLFTYYRPIITCLIVDISDEFDEWGAFDAWNFVAEEV